MPMGWICVQGLHHQSQQRTCPVGSNIQDSSPEILRDYPKKRQLNTEMAQETFREIFFVLRDQVIGGKNPIYPHFITALLEEQNFSP